MTRIETRFAAARGRAPQGLRRLRHGGRPRLRHLARRAARPARRRGRRGRARHAVHRPDGRRPGDPARRPARPRGGPDHGPHARHGPRLPRGRRRDADRADGLLQPDLFPRRPALPRRGEGGRGRRPDRRRPAARGGRRALPARPGGGAELHPPRHPHHRRPPAAAGAAPTPRASSTTSRSPASPAPPPPTPPPSPPRSPASRRATPLPVCVGFGIRTPEAAAAIAAVADGAVVGSAIVDRIGAGEPPAAVLAFVHSLAKAAHAT